MYIMKVKKRDGSYQKISFDKVLARLKELSYHLSINTDEIAQKVIEKIYDGVCTRELDEEASRICFYKSSIHPDYGKLASRIVVSNNHKNTPETFYEAMKIIYEANILDPTIYSFIKENRNKLNKMIQHVRDYDFDYFAFKTLEKSYLIKVKRETIERIQYMFLRISCGIHYPNLDEIKRTYEWMSKKYMIHATPTMYNAGTRNPQLISCFLTAMEDSVDGMYKWLRDISLISRSSGGLGATLGNIRPSGSYIQGVNGYSSGIIPFCKVINENVKHISQQGGKRPGSIAIYLPMYHGDIFEFLELKLNTGNINRRCYNLFLAVNINDLFMKRVEQDTTWTLFDGKEVMELEKVYGEEFERLYEQYEKEGKGRQVKAKDVFIKLLLSMSETGVPYTLFIDNVNRKSNHKNIGTIRGSNLCIEIVEYFDKQEYACCCLGSLCLKSFVINNRFHFSMLGKVMEQMVRNLNHVIDRNLYPVEEARISNMRHRPLGIGVSGLADTFQLLQIPFDSQEAQELNKKIFECMYYHGLKSSMEEAKKYGSYETFSGSPYSQGILQFDMWNVTPKHYDWIQLKKDIQRYGIRNSMITACMPTASTSIILNASPCIEPHSSNIYSRKVHAGEFIVMNEKLIRDLIRLNIWNDEMRQRIIVDDGSIQHIQEIPTNIKQLYKTVWEIPQKVLLDLSIGRAPYIDQTQSLNIFMIKPDTLKLSRMLFYGWRHGLKTGSYYIKSNTQDVQAQRITIDTKIERKRKKEREEEEEMCKNKKECLSCSS